MLWLITFAAAVAAASALAGAIVGSVHWCTVRFLLCTIHDVQCALHPRSDRRCRGAPLAERGPSPPMTAELDVLRSLLRCRRPRLDGAERRALAEVLARLEAMCLAVQPGADAACRGSRETRPTAP